MDKIKNVAQRLGIITVEDMERYTALELILMIANKMNEFKEILNDQNDKIQYLLNKGLLSEVEQIFNEWLEDGTFDTLINKFALQKMTRINYIKFSKTNDAMENTMILQQAINDAVANGGGVIKLPIGKFDIYGVYIEGDNVTISGHGMGVTILNQVPTTQDFLDTLPTKKGIFSDVNHTRIIQIGTGRTESNYNRIEHLTLIGKKGKADDQNEWSNCIHIWQSHYNTIEWCELKNGLNYAVDIGADLPLRASNTVDGINVRNSNYNKVINCIESGSATIAVAITSGESNEIAFNHFEKKVDLEHNDVVLSSMKYNKVYGNTLNAIEIVSRTNMYSTDITVGNIISNNKLSSINLQYATETIISNNFIQGDLENLIKVSGSHNTIISDNNMVGGVSTKAFIMTRGSNYNIHNNNATSKSAASVFIDNIKTFGDLTQNIGERANNTLTGFSKYSNAIHYYGEKSYYKLSRDESNVFTYELIQGFDILSSVKLIGAGDTLQFTSAKGGGSNYYINVVNQALGNGERVGVKLLPLDTSVGSQSRTYSLIKEYYDAITTSFKQSFWQSGPFNIIIEVIY